jgi:dihydroorotate dehydrogenase
MYKLLIKPLLFQFDPEAVHHFVFRFLKISCKIPGVKTLLSAIYSTKNPQLQVNTLGLSFPNPVGLAAGFDKNAELIDELACLGFGFIEIGTVTPLAQAGNDKPRLFRLPADAALINRMGFNNAGVDAVVQNLKKRKSGIIIGGNIGKNKLTPNHLAVNDYLICFEKLFDYVDYFVVNVSSPNTPGLRELQEKGPLLEILNSLQAVNLAKTKPKPILLKIAPDLNTEQLADIVSIVADSKIAGIIATNTTIDRSNLATASATLTAIGAGGLSGKPLAAKSTEVLSYLYKNSPKNTNLIAVGGIDSGSSAHDKLAAGAQLVQVYTGFIYQGAGIVKRICKGL